VETLREISWGRNITEVSGAVETEGIPIPVEAFGWSAKN